MKTPEEILQPLRGKGNFIHCLDYDDAVKAMSEHAKNVAQEYSKWCSDNEYQYLSDDIWMDGNGKTITADDLYNLGYCKLRNDDSR